MSNSSEESAPRKLEDVVVEKTGALSPSDSIQTAGDRMRSVEANAWPVAEGRKLVGVIDQANPDRQAGGHGHDPSTTSVGETMRHEAVFCYEDQNAAEADKIMQEKNLKHLPVVDRNMRIVGIISHDDVKGAAEVPGSAEAPDHSDGATPAEDWKPGETHGSDGDSPDESESTPYGRDGSSPESRAPDEDRDEVDHDRFPFQVAAEKAEVR
jgi:CBS domain-containing protein